ncbi:MAG: hypothetical protein HY455_03080 [Parcubacteria group bacterium]|nr:hypothetical protein [Parcubacteria group bacterium]
MGLPQGWDGIFYGLETNGDMLFDLEPEALIAELLKYPKQAAFLVAGAITDLFIHDPNSEKAIELVRLACTHPSLGKFPWLVLAYNATVVRFTDARKSVEPEAATVMRSGIYDIVQRTFNDVSLKEALQEQAAVQGGGA